jgi:hypothetical protein
MHPRVLLLLRDLPLLLACPTQRDDDDDDDSAVDDDDSAVDDDDAADDDDAVDDDDCFDDYTPTFDGKGCFDWEGAQGLCGFDSDGTVCELAVGCGFEPDLSQCSIDCEMFTTVACYDLPTIECVMAATCAEDCDALALCNYFM